MPRNVAALIIGVILLAAGVSGVATADHTNPPPADQVFSVDDKVDVWNQSPVPLRADTGSAKTSFFNADWRARRVDGTENSLNRNTIGVFDEGQTITLRFDLSDVNGDASSFSGERVQLLAVRLSDGDLPESFTEATSLLVDQDRQDVTFERAAEKSLDGSGDQSFSHTPASSGRYLYFLAIPESGKTGFVVNSGNLTIDGNVTVIGIDRATVIKKSMNLNNKPGPVERGNSATFNGRNPFAGSTTHAVVLYNADKYPSQSFRNDLQSPLDSSFDVHADSSLQTTIDEVDGQAKIEASMSGEDIAINNKMPRWGGFRGIFDFIGERLSGNQIGSDLDAGESTTLEASVRIQKGSSINSMQVPTEKSWATGTYRWIYFIDGGDRGEIALKSGTLRVTKVPEPSGPGGGGGGDGGLGDSTDLIATSDEMVVKSVPPGPITRVRLRFAAPSNGIFEINDSRSLPRKAPHPPGTLVDVVAIEPPEDFSTDETTVQTRVNRSTLPPNASPESLRLLRYNPESESFDRLDTQPAEVTNKSVLLEATVTQFSLFVVVAPNKSVTKTPISTPSPTPTPSATPPTSPTSSHTPHTSMTAQTTTTTGEAPGFGIVVFLVAMILTSLLILNREYR